MAKETSLIQATKEDISLVDNCIYNTNQWNSIYGKTPKTVVKTRKGKGGKDWSYVSVGHVIKKLNKTFGGHWSFEIKTDDATALMMAEKTGAIALRGRLTIYNPDTQEFIFKEQYGRKEVAHKKDSNQLLDFGNDMKAAASDALKKCASEFGFFSDIYAEEDFLEIEVIEDGVDTDYDKEQEQILKASQDKATQIANLYKQNN